MRSCRKYNNKGKKENDKGMGNRVICSLPLGGRRRGGKKQRMKEIRSVGKKKKGGTEEERIDNLNIRITTSQNVQYKTSDISKFVFQLLFQQM